MENQELILKYKDEEREFAFTNKVNFVEDKKLVQNLSRPNIKNQDSSLIIKSLNDTHISDVIQLKINVGETGSFLASFSKDSLDDETRTKLLEEIGKLKSSDEPTLESQSQKIKELLGILNDFSPIYVAFSNTGDIKLELDKVVDFEMAFPLLILKQPEKKFIFKIGKQKEKTEEEKPVEQVEERPVDQVEEKPVKEKKQRVRKEYQPFALFDSDYFFALFFALLASFSITASVFELMNKEGIATFLIILAVVLTTTLVIAVTSVIYKKGELRNPWLRYYLGIYVLVGLIGGVVAGYFICKGLLKTEIEDFNYKKMMLISSLISASLLLSLSLSRLVNLLLKKIKLKKKPQ